LTIRQGDIFWVDMGEPNGSDPGYRHPHVVVQNNVFNISKINTVVVCALTSNLKRATTPGNVLLRKGEADLPKDSVVNIAQMLTVNKTDLQQKIGSVPAGKTKEIIEGIKLLLEPREVE
jgi:mRNA interferase MazF